MGDACESDRDSDGVIDDTDNCPTVPNADQDAAACEAIAKFSFDWTGGTKVSFDATPSAVSNPDLPLTSYKWDFGDGTTGTGRYASHTYYKPGRYSVKLTVTAENGSTATEQKWVVVDPVKTFAPAVYIYPGENYRPASAEKFLQNSQLRWDKPNYKDASCKDQVLAASSGFPNPDVPLLSYSDLSGTGGAFPYWHRGTMRYVTQEPVRTTCKSTTEIVRSNAAPEVAAKKENPLDGYVLNLRGSDPDILKAPLYAGEQNPAVDPPVYTEYEPGRYIVYWFFYPFNGWTDRDRFDLTKEYHEGDWEHITVKLNSDDDATDVAYYQHYCDAKKYSWGSATVDKVAGTHPKVYSALGGHASFASVDDGTPVACKLSRLDWASANGDRWDTWNNTVDARTKSWYGYGGAWGDRSEYSTSIAAIDNYGPSGPGPIRSKASDVVPPSW